MVRYICGPVEQMARHKYAAASRSTQNTPCDEFSGENRRVSPGRPPIRILAGRGRTFAGFYRAAFACPSSKEAELTLVPLYSEDISTDCVSESTAAVCLSALRSPSGFRSSKVSHEPVAILVQSNSE